MMFLSNINYVIVAVVGGLRVTAGAISIGDVQAFLRYTCQFSMPLTQMAAMVNLLQSGVAGRAGHSPARRPGADLRRRRRAGEEALGCGHGQADAVGHRHE